jgi:hypothetical protein
VPAPAAPVPKLVNLDGFGNLPAGSAGAPAPDPGFRGTALLRLFGQGGNDPCVPPPAKQGQAPGGAVPAGGPNGGVVKDKGTILFPKPPVAKPVNVKIVPKIQQQQAVAPANQQASLYTDSKINVRWAGDEHVAHLAPTDTGGAAAAVALAAPTLQMIVEWEAERVGGVPVVPPANLGKNYVLLEREKSNPAVELAADGYTPVVRTAGHYVYAVLDPSAVVQGAALPPWVLDQLRAMQTAGGGSGASALGQMLDVVAANASAAEDRGTYPWLSTQA